MKAPICTVCGRYQSPDASDRFELVAFADCVFLEPGCIGHPYGLEWFCPVHIPAAKALSSLRLDAAMIELDALFPAEAAKREAQRKKQEARARERTKIVDERANKVAEAYKAAREGRISDEEAEKIVIRLLGLL